MNAISPYGSYCLDFCQEKRQKRIKAERRSKNKTELDTRTDEDIQDKVKAGKLVVKQAHLTVEDQDRRTLKNTDDPYQDILEVPKTGYASPFQKQKCKVSVSIGVRFSRMFPVICVFGTGAGATLIRTGVLDKGCRDNIRPSEMPEI